MSLRPTISAIVCTHNRLSYLDGSIGSLDKQTLPTDEFEIIVVDNRSTDDTADWCRTKATSVRNLRYVFESRLGLTHARNAGWRAAAAESIRQHFPPDPARDFAEILLPLCG